MFLGQFNFFSIKKSLKSNKPPSDFGRFLFVNWYLESKCIDNQWIVFLASRLNSIRYH